MLRTILDARALVALIVAALIGVCGLRVYPLPTENVFFALMALRAPRVFHVVAYGYATLWFTTPWIGTSVVTSVLAMIAYRRRSHLRHRALPAYPAPEAYPNMFADM